MIVCDKTRWRMQNVPPVSVCESAWMALLQPEALTTIFLVFQHLLQSRHRAVRSLRYSFLPGIFSFCIQIKMNKNQLQKSRLASTHNPVVLPTHWLVVWKMPSWIVLHNYTAVSGCRDGTVQSHNSGVIGHWKKSQSWWLFPYLNQGHWALGWRGSQYLSAGV